MSFVIEWSPTAKQTFLEIVEHIEQNWTKKESVSFIEKTERVLRTIGQFPRSFPYSIEGDVYKCVIAPQTSLFYRYRNDKVELLFFWDNRKDPSRLRF